jgi:hypothetical protein
LELTLADLGLNLNAPANKGPLVASVGRDLKEGDLSLLKQGNLGSKASPLKRIRAVHHQAAQLMASGEKQVYISQITGICQSRLSILKNDPSFSELLSHYEEIAQEKEKAILESKVDIKHRMASLGTMAAEELLARIEEEPELLGNKDLVEVLKASLDRGGYAPVSKVVKEHTLGQELLEQIKNEAHIIEGERVDEKEATVPHDSGAPVGGADATLALPGTEEASWEPCEGESLREEVPEVPE